MAGPRRLSGEPRRGGGPTGLAPSRRSRLAGPLTRHSNASAKFHLGERSISTSTPEECVSAQSESVESEPIDDVRGRRGTQ